MIDFIAHYSSFLLISTAFVFFLLETTLPFRDTVEKRARHIARNVALTACNAIILTAAYVFILEKASRFADTHNPGFVKLLPGVWQWIILFLLFDIVLYFWHRANHRLPFLWRFHSVHHADRDLDFSSATRFHFGELFISILVKALFMIVTGATFTQIVIFDFLVTLFAQFNHSNLHVRGRVEKCVRSVIVTPDMHRVHHSQKFADNDSNFCTMFSWWDRLFGSYRINDRQKEILIGLKEYDDPRKTTLQKILTMPLRKK